LYTQRKYSDLCAEDYIDVCAENLDVCAECEEYPSKIQMAVHWKHRKLAFELTNISFGTTYIPSLKTQICAVGLQAVQALSYLP